jgi:HK97 family phage portal protein
MIETTTPSGLVVHDRRHDRAMPPNGNTPPGTVGPDHLAPGRNVMWPAPQPGWPEGGWHSEEWDGWPVDWQTPPREDFGHGSSLPGTGGGEWTGYGWGRQDPTLAKVSTAMTCVDLNSRQLASFATYGMRGDQPTTLPDWASSPEPELYESWPAFMLGAVNSLQLRGEVILLVTGRMASGRIARFIAVNPDHVDVEWIDGRRVFTLAGDELPAEDVLLTRYQTLPGRLRGITPLEWAASSITTSASLGRYAAGLATRGGIPWAVLKSQRNVSKDQAEQAQARWVAAAQRRDGAPAVLGNEWDIEPLTISPKDMALLELREFDERRVASAFGVPSYLVNVAMAGGLTGLPTKSWVQ